MKNTFMKSNSKNRIIIFLSWRVRHNLTKVSSILTVSCRLRIDIYRFSKCDWDLIDDWNLRAVNCDQMYFECQKPYLRWHYLYKLECHLRDIHVRKKNIRSEYNLNKSMKMTSFFFHIFTFRFLPFSWNFKRLAVRLCTCAKEKKKKKKKEQKINKSICQVLG